MQNHLSSIRSLVALCLIASLIAGCGLFRKNTTRTETEDPDQITGIESTPVETTVERPLPILLQPENRPVVQGPIDEPLVYLVPSETTLRVTDFSNRVNLGDFPAKKGQIVRITREGVRLDRELVIPGPLNGSLYAIFIVSQNQSEIRQTTTTPRVEIVRPKPPVAEPAATPDTNDTPSQDAAPEPEPGPSQDQPVPSAPDASS